MTPPIENYIVSTDKGKICRPNESIFPILKQLDDDNYRLIGTGFFISEYGIFLTAKHVLLDVLNEDRNQTDPIIAFLFPQNGIYQIRRVMKGFLSGLGDVAAGVLDIIEINGKVSKNPYLGINLQPLEMNEKVFTYAYPETTHLKGQINVCGKYYNGQVTSIFPDGRDTVMFPNPCYQTDINIIGGASGGPVFNSSGSVCGINSSSIACSANDSPISFISNINEISKIIIEDVRLGETYFKSSTIGELIQAGYIKALS